MEIQTLKVKIRTQVGTRSARRGRAQGQIPAVLYGGEGEAVSLVIDTLTLNHVLHGRQGEHAIVQVEVDGQPELNSPALVRDVQHHPVRGDVTHADFQRIRLDQKIHALIPVRSEGRSPGVLEGGVLDHQSREIEIECLAMDVPECVIADISEMELGQTLFVSDLQVPEGIVILTPADRPVMAVHMPRVHLEEEVEAVEGEEVEGEEGAEGEEGEEGAEDSEEASESDKG